MSSRKNKRKQRKAKTPPPEGAPKPKPNASSAPAPETGSTSTGAAPPMGTEDAKEQQLDRARTTSAELQEELDATKAELEEAERQRDALRSESEDIDRRGVELAAGEEQLAEKEGQLQDGVAKLRADRAQLEQLEEELGRREGEAIQFEAALAAVEAKLEQAVAEHKLSVSRWEGSAVERERRAGAAEAKAATAARADVQAENERLAAEAQERADGIREAARREAGEILREAASEAARRRDVAAEDAEALRSAAREDAASVRERAAEDRRTVLSESEQAAEELRSEAIMTLQDATELRNARQGERTRLVKQHEALLLELEAATAALQEQEQELELERARLDSRRARLDRRQEGIEELARLQASEQLARLEAEQFELENQLDARNRVLESAVKERDDLREIVERAKGGKAAQFKAEADALRQQRDEFRSQLDTLPSPAEIEALRAAAERAGDTEDQNEALRRRLSELERNRYKAQADRVTLSGEREVAEAYRATNAQLRTELEALRAIHKDHKGTPMLAFQEVAQQDPPSLPPATDPESLPWLVGRLRDAMAALPDGRARCYPAETIATFLGGLAASQSRLVVLQGLPGTGKTSLPVAVAEAMGAGHRVIEVQSQWRDRGDLVGTWNPFHRRFYAQDFALALYEAGTRAYAQRPYFIVLDEMNLAYVEHYFADVLSRMERHHSEHHLRLVEDRVALQGVDLPKRIEDGRLPIPPNVWFIGTANDDESTRQISPKVYDRAFVMDLNDAPINFEPESESSPVGVRVEALRSLLQPADARLPTPFEEAEQSWELVEKPLRDKLRITRTGRFRAQWSAFGVAYSAAMGRSAVAAGQAFDHFLATKLLRELVGRFDPAADTILEELESATLETIWQKGWPNVAASQSMRLVKQQRARR